MDSPPCNTPPRLSDFTLISEVTRRRRMIGAGLPALILAHSLPVVVAMLGQKSKEALLACRQGQHCTAEEAQAIVQRVQARFKRVSRSSAD